MNHFDRTEEPNDITLLGAQLRELREAQRLTYDDVAKTTHVRPHILKSIEDGKLDGIAAPVYVRGFVKTYCEYLMAHDLWKKYSVALPSADSPGPKNDRLYSAPLDISHPRPVFKRTSIIWVYIILIVAVCGAAFLLWNQHRNPDSAQNGFFLRFSTGSSENGQNSDPAPVESISDDITYTSAEPTDEVSSDTTFVPVSDTPVIPPVNELLPTDLSWLDGNETAQANQNISVPLSQIPDRRLLIEITGPVRLIVQQDGAVVTRRSMTVGGVRSYDVAGATPVSLSAGKAAEVTWNGTKYSPIGSDNKPLALTFYPDGRVELTEGQSPHFSTGMNSLNGN